MKTDFRWLRQCKYNGRRVEGFFQHVIPVQSLQVVPVGCYLCPTSAALLVRLAATDFVVVQMEDKEDFVKVTLTSIDLKAG